MKKLNKLVVIAVVVAFVATMVFTGCSTATAATTTAAAETTAAAATTAAAETTAAATTAATATTKSQDAYTFAVVTSGIHPYFDQMRTACVDAGKDFGIPEPVYKAPQVWDQTQQNVILDGLVVQGIKGIAISPSDAVAGNEEVNKIIAAGIPVTDIAIELAKPNKVPFAIATDTGKAATDAINALIKAMGGKGNIVHLCGALSDPHTQARVEAVNAAIAANPGVKLLQQIGDTDSTAEATKTIVDTLFAAKEKQIDGIICTGWVPSVAVTNKLIELNDPAKRIKVACNDHDPIVLKGIQDGWIVCTTPQNPYLQAYIGILSLKYIVDGYTWKTDNQWIVNSGNLLITKDNVGDIQNLLIGKAKDMAASWKDMWNAPAQ